MADEEREEREVAPKTRTGKEQADALDRVTDQEEERTIKAADTSKVKKAMEALAAETAASFDAQRQRERELAAVKVAQEDLDVLAEEFELSKKTAERKLREAKGDIKAAIEALVKA